ncbi:unnamed protein product [Cuscuta epithymum]|uniref:F-box domain-containing protein n=1 Tax=Cuscuta epithymum TaxID=186058 RepID=A0AAV0G3A5_9ASTE|nr:unnamed protein product [Cuscuta epithymum]
MDEQILTRILLYLPPKSVYRFRVVSKSWNDLISHPFFIRRYDSERRGGGLGLLFLFYEQMLPCNIRYSKPPMNSNKNCKIVPLDIPGCRKMGCPPEEQKLGMFINSSNGLILCYSYCGALVVLNPFTKKSVSLPPPPPLVNRYETIGLMCEENKSELEAKYTVIRIVCEFRRPEKDSLHIVTYSSNTGLWAPTKPRVIISGDPHRVFHDISSPLVMNGVFHWYNTDRERLTLALYRPGGEEVVQIRSYDGIYIAKYTSTAMTRSSIEDGDTLWFGCMERESISVFMLQNDIQDGRSNDLSHQEWVFKCSIRCDSLRSELVLSEGILLKGLLYIKNKKAPVALICFKGHRHGRVFLYDLDTDSLLSAPYHGPLTTSQHRNGYLYIKHFPDVYPYFEASSLSTFAL